MDAIVSKITQNVMNYAIRTGIGITASYAIKQTSRLLKTVNDNDDYRELHNLQVRLNKLITVVSPAIDMIELISARGNTTLDSAVGLSKDIRWKIQALGIRLQKAACAEELSRKKSGLTSSLAVSQKAEIRLIIEDIKSLLAQIEHDVPYINLAINTSGAKLSTSLPKTVSPSRMLQAGAFLNAGDIQYSMNPGVPVQVGPSFTLTLYMLFAGHSHRVYEEEGSLRGATWQEVMHKARVRLVRVPLEMLPSSQDGSILKSVENDEASLRIGSDGPPNEYAYRLEIVEDLDDDRVHSFDEDEPQPGPYGDVKLAGVRELLPTYQISRIFYADTGKILNISTDGETNVPVLLLRRDANAHSPRRPMQEEERLDDWDNDSQPEAAALDDSAQDEEDNSQDDIDQQIRRESSIMLPNSPEVKQSPVDDHTWKLPVSLDHEWLALSIYTEDDESNTSDDERDLNEDSAYESHRPSSSGDTDLANGIANLNINHSSPPPAARQISPSPFSTHAPQNHNQLGPIRSSLSLLEMLIRLAGLQQFLQASHLTAADELLIFFLEESSTTGAGGDKEERNRVRGQATKKIGFDPYDESPIKRHGEEYQYQNQGGGAGQDNWETFSRGGSPWAEDGGQRNPFPSSPRFNPRERSVTPQSGTPEPWLLRSREGDSRRTTPFPAPSSPISPYKPQKKAARPIERVQQEGRAVKGSPLIRGGSVETDSTLGTSPGSPTLIHKEDKM